MTVNGGEGDAVCRVTHPSEVRVWQGDGASFRPNLLSGAKAKCLSPQGDVRCCTQQRWQPAKDLLHCQVPLRVAAAERGRVQGHMS